MDKYAELRAALDAFKPGNGDAMLAYRLASDPTTIRALLAERDALRVAVEALLANPSGMYCDGYPEAERKARAALAQEQGEKHD